MNIPKMGLALVAVLAAAAAPAGTPERGVYDLVFRTGTLDGVPRSATLVYDREVVNSLVPEAEARDSGEVRLAFADDGSDEARLVFFQGDRHRAIGAFPVDVGNPVIMYFMETVVRDMSESAGGSPFYIRNRLKEALVRPAEVRDVTAAYGADEVPAQSVTLHPFENDPNGARMQGFEALALTVTMSDKVPGWYSALSAVVPGAAGGEPVYASTLVLEPPEAAR
jgi:hypothetical protein